MMSKGRQSVGVVFEIARKSIALAVSAPLSVYQQ